MTVAEGVWWHGKARGPEWQSVIKQAEANHARCLWKARVRRGTRKRWPPRKDVFEGYRPTKREWLVMCCLADGPLLGSDHTIPGAHVGWMIARELCNKGLAVKEGRLYRLTDEGRARVERGW